MEAQLAMRSEENERLIKQVRAPSIYVSVYLSTCLSINRLLPSSSLVVVKWFQVEGLAAGHNAEAEEMRTRIAFLEEQLQNMQYEKQTVCEGID